MLCLTRRLLMRLIEGQFLKIFFSWGSNGPTKTIFIMIVEWDVSQDVSWELRKCACVTQFVSWGSHTTLTGRITDVFWIFLSTKNICAEDKCLRSITGVPRDFPREPSYDRLSRTSHLMGRLIWKASHERRPTRRSSWGNLSKSTAVSCESNQAVSWESHKSIEEAEIKPIVVDLSALTGRMRWFRSLRNLVMAPEWSFHRIFTLKESFFARTRGGQAKEETHSFYATKTTYQHRPNMIPAG